MLNKSSQLDRLENLAKMVNESYVKPEELAAVVDSFLSTLKEIKASLIKEIGSASSQNSEAVKKALAVSRSIISDVDERASKALAELMDTNQKEHGAIYKKLQDEIEQVKSFIPDEVDLSHLEDSISELHSVISDLPRHSDVKSHVSKKADEMQTLIDELKYEIQESIDDAKKDIETIRATKQIPMLHTPSIGNLPDVNIVGATTGQVLTYNGTYWYPSTPASSFQLPLTGAVDGVNQTYTWTNAPSAIVVDGVPYQQVKQDGTVNWTGTTTTVLTFIPSTEIFAIA